MLLRYAFLCALLCLGTAYGQGRRGPGFGGPGLRILDAQPGRPGQIVKGAPYTADGSTEVTQSLPDGNKIHQLSSEKVYRDSEGRTRRETSLTALGSTASANAPQLAFIDDPVAGVSFALDLTNRTATKMPFRQPPPGNRPPPPGPFSRRSVENLNIKAESLGRQVLAGVPADGTRTTETIPAGQIGNTLPIQIVSERWYSPDLQIVVMQRRSDPRSGETVFQLSNIVRGEPSPALFAPSADFQVTAGRVRSRRGETN